MPDRQGPRQVLRLPLRAAAVKTATSSALAPNSGARAEEMTPFEGRPHAPHLLPRRGRGLYRGDLGGWPDARPAGPRRPPESGGGWLLDLQRPAARLRRGQEDRQAAPGDP